MNDDLDPDDPHDPELARALGALAPPSAAGDDAYARALPGFVRARQRHRVVTVSAAVTIAAAVVVGIALTSGAPKLSGVKTVDPAGRSTTQPTRPTSSDTTPASTTTTTTAGGNPAGTPTGTDPGANPPSGSTPSTAATTPVSGTTTQTFTSAGGSIVVTLGARNVTLVSEAPAAGYSTDIRASGPSEVEVRFRMGSSGSTEHRIRLRFDSAGNLVKEIT